MAKIKDYSELKFTDDFMFCKVLTTHPDLAEELVGLLLGRTVHIAEAEKQKMIEITANGRGIRLDVHFEDDDKVLYNIEMQNENEGDLPKRSRYHQGMIDLDQLERGSFFSDLKKTYIVFICPFDPIGAGRYRYTFEARCVEDPNIQLDDGSYRVFINSKPAAQDAPPEMTAFLDYINGKKPASDLTRRIDDVVADAIEHKKWRKEYMTLLERDLKNRQEGRAEEKKDNAREMINMGMDDATISQVTKLTSSQISELRKEKLS